MRVLPHNTYRTRSFALIRLPHPAAEEDTTCHQTASAFHDHRLIQPPCICVLTLPKNQGRKPSPQSFDETIAGIPHHDHPLVVQADPHRRVITMPQSKIVPVDWRKSITKHAVICLECGESFKQLSLRHLRAHGLDNRSYRTRYGIPPIQPLSARVTTERRRQVVQEVRPWEKKQQLLQARECHGDPSPDLDGEAVDEAAEEPGMAAPAQPKRQRKTSAKKTARQTRSEG
jgi:predicted transcriptional regulator